MIDFLWQLWELAVTLFECVVSTKFVCCFLGQETQSNDGRRRWFGLALCYASAVSILNSIMPYEGALDIIYIAICFIYCCAFLPGTIKQKGFISVFYLCVVVMDSSFGANLVSAVMNTDISVIYSTAGLSRFLAMLLVQILNMFVFKTLTSVMGRSKADFHIAEWALLGGVFLLSIAGMVLIQISLLRTNAQQTERLLLLGVDIIIITINYIAIRLLLHINRLHEKDVEHKLLKEQTLYQMQYAKNMQQQEESIHKLRHDFKATVAVLQNFIAGNDLEGASRYLVTYQHAIEKTASIIHTNQPFLNAILNSKLTYAKEYRIKCSCHSPEVLPQIDNIDCCVLLGNLLDNAIEAERDLNIPNPEIQVHLSLFGDSICISVRNRIGKSVLESNPNLLTTKHDVMSHGFGVRTIREIVKKHQGTVIFYEEKKWFVVNVDLPIM